ncbi:MAG: hypothetical protein H0X33_07520 [Taibaiella sp.]|nr:hypothetical protein [Taibaiella sp.]
MKTILSAGLLLMGGAMLFTACSKSDSTTPVATNSTKIIGTWKKIFDATDANNNGIPDASEKIAPASGDYEYQTYKTGGAFLDSLKAPGIAGTSSGSWSITGDYRILVSPNTMIGKLYQLDATTMIILDTSVHPSQWVAYSKQ